MTAGRLGNVTTRPGRWQPTIRTLMVVLGVAAIVTTLSLTGQASRFDAVVQVASTQATVTGECSPRYSLTGRRSRTGVTCPVVLETGQQAVLDGVRYLKVGDTLKVYGNGFDDTYEMKPPSTDAQFVLTTAMYVLWAAVLVLLVARVRPVDWARELASISGTPVEEMREAIDEQNARQKQTGHRNKWVWVGTIVGIVGSTVWWLLT